MQVEYTKIMDSSTSNQTLEEFFSLVDEEIVGGKPCGVGGGGCGVFCCRGEEWKGRATEKVNKADFITIDFGFDFQGSRVSIES